MLSTQQQAALEFFNASVNLRAVADDGHGRGLLDFTEAFIVAVNAFGQAELNARRDERLRASGLRPEGGASARLRVAELNERGLRALGSARSALARFREELAQFPGDADVARDADQAQRDVREQLVELDLKTSDLKKIDAALTEGFELAKQGAKGIPDYLGHQLSELERLRRSADRGAVENIPVWKVAAIAIAVGIWIWALFRCRWWGSCSIKEGLGYFIVFWLAVLIAKYD